MYHSISEPQEKNIHPYYETCTSPEVFAQHMKFLYENDCQVLSLEEAARLFGRSNNSSNFTNGISFNEQSHESSLGQNIFVVLTFDDGYRDFYTHAFPLLKKYGFPASVFLPTDFIGEKRKKFKGKECLIWPEVRQLSKEGISFGSHTVTHPKLINTDIKQLKYELFNSKKIIEKKSGCTVNEFSYPYAFPEQDKNFVSVLRSLIQQCGYSLVLTTIIGTLSPGYFPFFLPRLPINNFDDKMLFEAKLFGRYDYMNVIQKLFKRLKK